MGKVLKVVSWDGYQLSDRHKRRLARQPDPWFPLWIDKWLFGATKYELTPAERTAWIGMLAVAYKNNGYIMADKRIPYPLPDLAVLLKVPLNVLKRTIEKCTDPDINKLKWVEFVKRDATSSKADTMSEKADAKRNETKQEKTKEEIAGLIGFAFDWFGREDAPDVFKKDGYFSRKKLKLLIQEKPENIADITYARIVLKHIDEKGRRKDES